jgi:glycogen(starch) synthase
MRLLITTDTVGGVWTYTTELTRGLLQKGITVALVILGRAPSPEQARWLRETASCWSGAFRWEAAEEPLEWMSDNERAYQGAEPVLLRVAKEFQPDLLHSNQFCFGALPLPVPKLLVAHSDVLSWAASCRDQAIELSPWLDRYCALTNAGLRGADALVAPTRWMLRTFTAGFHVACATYVVANGRNIEAPRLSPHRRLQAVTAGRLWDEAKDLKMLAGVNFPFPLLVAGETEYESNTSPSFPAGTVALGPLAEKDLLSLFEQSAIYLCTSRYEPFGLAPLEAALCGCAVLARDIPSLREVWGGGALYFRDAAGLSHVLDQLARKPEQLRVAQHRSRRRARKYTARRMTEQYLACYQAMLAKPAASAHVNATGFRERVRTRAAVLCTRKVKVRVS